MSPQGSRQVRRPARPAASPSRRDRRRRRRPGTAPSTPARRRRSPPTRRGSRATRGSAASAARRPPPGPRPRCGSASAGTGSRRAGPRCGMCHGRPCRSTDARMPPASRAPSRCVCAYASGSRISVSTARAAAIASGLPKIVPPVATRFERSPSGPLRCSRSSAIGSVMPQAPNGRPPAIDLPATSEVGLEAPLGGQPARAEDLGVGLVDGEQRARLAGQSAELGVEAVVGQQEADVVGDRGLGQHDARRRGARARGRAPPGR